MNSDRRFIFRGQASGVAAHMRRPADRNLHVHGVSSLPVIGGYTSSVSGPQRLGEFLSFESAETSANGDFTDKEAVLAMTLHKRAWDSSPTRTEVSAQVRGFHAGGRIAIAVADAGLTSHSPVDDKQPSILLSRNRLEGIRVDRSVLKITLEEDFFNQCDTETKLRDEFAKGLEPRHSSLLCVPRGMSPAQFPSSAGITYCTVVARMEWEGTAHPHATIDGNVLTVPGLGTVYFGELLLTGISRRLTMVRFRFGSDDGGEGTLSEVETNGQYWP